MPRYAVILERTIAGEPLRPRVLAHVMAEKPVDAIRRIEGRLTLHVDDVLVARKDTYRKLVKVGAGSPGGVGLL